MKRGSSGHDKTFRKLWPFSGWCPGLGYGRDEVNGFEMGFGEGTSRIGHELSWGEEARGIRDDRKERY